MSRINTTFLPCWTIWRMANGRPQHAHVRMHAHHDHVANAALLHQIEGFDVVGDGVTVGDVERGNLSAPGILLRAGRLAIAAAVGIVDRQLGLFGQVELATADQRNFGFNLGGLLGQLPLRRVFVELHATAGAMDDEHALAARGRTTSFIRGAISATRRVAPWHQWRSHMSQMTIAVCSRIPGKLGVGRCWNSSGLSADFLPAAGVQLQAFGGSDCQPT